MSVNSLTPHRRVCLSLLLFVILLTVCGALARLFALSVPYVDIALCSLLPAGSVLALYVWRKKPDVKAFFRLTPVSLREAALWFFFGICANCAGALINVPLNLFWSYFIDTAPGVPAPQSFGEYLLGILCAAAVPALCEELLCRGLVLREYENYGRRFAIIASAAAFALLHNSMQNLVFTLLLGLVLALIVTRTGSVYPAMIFHFAVNFFSITMSYVSQSLIAPHMQPAFSLALNLLYLCMALTFVFSFLLFLKNTHPPQASDIDGESARPKLGFSVSLILLICWFVFSQVRLFLT